MQYALSLVLTLYALWLLLSGYFEPLLLILGIMSCALVVVIALRMDVIDHESHPLPLIPKLPLYVPWLLWQIVQANLAVCRLILHPKLPISPTVVRVRASQLSDVGRVTYANSITLTPGTVSMSLDGDQIEVHAVTEELARDLEAGEMDRRVCTLEGAPRV
jgi:multicomponent Na+:H+ antiporter subunit E